MYMHILTALGAWGIQQLKSIYYKKHTMSLSDVSQLSNETMSSDMILDDYTVAP